MNSEEYIDQVVGGLKEKIQELEDEISSMNSFFRKLSSPIIRKVIRIIERELRRFPEEALQFGDDSKLNFFEEVCVMQKEGSMSDYYFVSETIEMCCQDGFNQLNKNEQFILLHAGIGIFDDEIAYYIEQEFLQYCTDYYNKRINYAYERRN